MTEVSPGRAAYEAFQRAFPAEDWGPWERLGTDDDNPRAGWQDIARAAIAAAPNWPRCPDSCGCRLGSGDADSRECGCDGPCTQECRENGYPQAPSYRDTAIASVMTERDGAYRERARLVAFLAACYPAVMLTDDAEPDWPIVFVETPAGQMSWHIARADLGRFGHVPATTEPTWDGHTTEVKYERLAEMTDRIHRAGGMAGVIASVAAPERTGPYPTAVERDELRTERDGARDVVREMTAALAALGVTELGGAIIAQWRERAGLGEVTP